MKYLIKPFVYSLFISCLLTSCFKDKEVVNEEVDNETKTEKPEPTSPKETEIWEPKPKVVTVDSETMIPSDAIILFDGTDFDEWVSSIDSTEVKWVLNNDGSMTVKDKTGNIQTKRNFGDVQLHVEWRSSPENKGTNQSKSNSGIFLQSRYEVQVLDNNDNDTYVNGQVGSIYKQAIPLANASSKTGDWNVYDIIYHAPTFDSEGNKTKSGTITLLHNNVLIQDHYEIKGTTEYIGWPKNVMHGDAPLKLQDHGDNSRVSYRNIWIRHL